MMITWDLCSHQKPAKLSCGIVCHLYITEQTSPSHIKGKHYSHNMPLMFSFLWDVLQVQKFIELDEMKRLDVQAEEEPEGEMLVGLGGEALRPPGMNTTICFLSLSWYIWAAAPFVVICFTLRALLPPGEPEEDKGETEEPEVCTPEPVLNSIGSPYWLKEGRELTSGWWKGSRGYFPRYFCFLRLLDLSYSLLRFCSFFFYLGFWPCFKIKWYFNFFQGLHLLCWAQCFLKQEADNLKAEANLTGDWRSSANIVCCGWFWRWKFYMTFFKLLCLNQRCLCLLAYPCTKGTSRLATATVF